MTIITTSVFVSALVFSCSQSSDQESLKSEIEKKFQPEIVSAIAVTDGGADVIKKMVAPFC